MPRLVRFRQIPELCGFLPQRPESNPAHSWSSGSHLRVFALISSPNYRFILHFSSRSILVLKPWASQCRMSNQGKQINLLKHLTFLCDETSQILNSFLFPWLQSELLRIHFLVKLFGKFLLIIL